MKGVGIPFVSSITEHEALIACAHVIFIDHLAVDTVCNLSRLSLDVDDDLAVVAVNSDLLACESYFPEGLPYNLFEVNLTPVDVDLTEEHNLVITPLAQR